jgi:hypothetical protein
MFVSRGQDHYGLAAPRRSIGSRPTRSSFPYPSRRGSAAFSSRAVDALLSKGSSSAATALPFFLICRYFSSGGTRIRTGDTMIFRFVLKPAVNRHRPPWAESKRLLEAAHRRGPPPNAMDRHAVVVGSWWAQRVPEREDSEQWNGPGRGKKGARSYLYETTSSLRTPPVRSH